MISKETAQSLLHIAEKYGTPIYVYQGEKIEEKFHFLKNSFKKFTPQIYYAMKALWNPHILKILFNMGAGIDAVSINEIKLALQVGFLPNQIMFTPNSVEMAEITEAKNLGVRINIDNLIILRKFAELYNDSYPVCIRINPHIMAGGNYKISTGHIDSKFGISTSQIKDIFEIINTTGLLVNGLHLHTGSDIFESEVFIRSADILLDQARLFPNLDYLDFGSGFKVAYSPTDQISNIPEIANLLEARLSLFFNEYGRTLQICFEPGKYLVSESGFFLTKVNVLKKTPSQVFACVNSGFNHLIRPMFYDAYHHISNLSNLGQEESIYSVVGNICETDTFAKNRSLSQVRENDILCFHNAGAYCQSMSSHYNLRPKCAELLLYNQEVKVIRKAETLSQILENIPPFSPM